MQDLCPKCGFALHPAKDRCPHCGGPALPPNVRLAAREDERAALEARYEEARREAAARNAGERLEAFERAAERSQAVITKPFAESERLAASESTLYSTYYQRREAELFIPRPDGWNVRRGAAEERLFPGFKEKVHFGALSLTGEGVASYGGGDSRGFCFWVLRDEMIANRASVLEENGVLLVERYAHSLPLGSRATWAERAKLCVARLASEVESTTTDAEFQNLLLRQGRTSEDEQFVEVHVWGSFSVRTLERIIFVAPKQRSRAIATILRTRLESFGIPLEVRQR